MIWKLDRLARSLSHLLKLADRFETSDVQLVTADGTVDTTTAAGRAFYAMRGTFAQFERDTVSERARSMHAWLRSQNRVQSRTPYGFRVNSERRLERDPKTWPTLVEMVERIAAGDSLRAVGADYGVPHTTVRVYVRNLRVIHELEKDRPGLAAALRSRLADSTFRPGPRSLLAGLAYCSVCSSKMRQGRRDGRRIYECKVAGHVRIDADWLDEFVVRDVLTFTPWVLEREQGEGTVSEDRSSLERRLTELEDDHDAGLVTRERFVARRASLLERLGRVTEAPPKPRLVTASWDDLSQPERRLALREVLEYVEVKPVPKGKSRKLPHASRVTLGMSGSVDIEPV